MPRTIGARINRMGEFKVKLFDILWNCFMLSFKKVDAGDNLVIYGRLYVHGRKGGVKIGNNCMLMSSENVNPTSGMNHIHLVIGSDGTLEIGNRVGISHANITAYDKVVIEDDVLIGSGVKIWDTDFHPIDYTERIKSEVDGTTKPIVIREGAFIGGCSIILKGADIGKRAVIGAGSVVTGKIPDDEVWAGNPARFIKRIKNELVGERDNE